MSKKMLSKEFTFSPGVTQHQIAAAAGVTQSVVSRVLSDRAKQIGISSDTIEKVLTIARQMGYRPNPGVSIMQGRKTSLLGVIVRSFQDPFLGTILDELNHQAHSYGLTLLVKGFESGIYDDKEMLSLLSYGPDALILVGTMDLETWNPSVLKSGKLIVQIGSRSKIDTVVTCGLDEADAARQIATHLRDKGHKTCGIVGNISSPTQLRAQRIKSALSDFGIESKTKWQEFSELSYYEAGRHAAQMLAERFGRKMPFSSVVAVGDTIAMGFIKEAESNGISIPEDIALCSYNNLEFSSFTKPSLTTIHQPLREMAQTAIRIATGIQVAETVRIKPSLIIRESSS